MHERYNEPGVIQDANWSLRVPFDFHRTYAERVARDVALDVCRCIQLAAATRARLVATAPNNYSNARMHALRRYR